MSSYDTMRNAAVKSLGLVFPEGPHCAKMHADIIRVYSMGYLDCIRIQADALPMGPEKLKLVHLAYDLLQQYVSHVDPDWVPGKEWIWWTVPNPEMN